MPEMQAFPSISASEFADACAALETRSADRLGGTDWLSVKWTGTELLIKQQRDVDPVRHVPSRGDDNNITEQELEEELIEADTVSGALQA
jgi:hypothetical protein